MHDERKGTRHENTRWTSVIAAGHPLASPPPPPSSAARHPSFTTCRVIIAQLPPFNSARHASVATIFHSFLPASRKRLSSLPSRSPSLSLCNQDR